MNLIWTTEQVAALLALKDSGERQMELVSPRLVTPPEEAQTLRAAVPAVWFPEARSPEGALAELWLYFGAFEEVNELVQALKTAEGSYWHAIVHRIEPDAGNSGYWIWRVGQHGIFPALLAAARRIAATNPDCAFVPGDSWSSVRFTALCDAARGRPGSQAEQVAR